MRLGRGCGGAMSCRMASKTTLWTPQQFDRQAPLDKLKIVILGEDDLTVGVGYHGNHEVRDTDPVDPFPLQSKLDFHDLFPERRGLGCERKGIEILLELTELFWRPGSWDDFGFDQVACANPFFL